MRRRSTAFPGVSPGLAAALGAALLLFGCGAQPPAGFEVEAEPNLSTALAYRDGEPRLTITSPTDDATVTSPVLLTFDIANLSLSPAGETQDGEGHLHIFVDRGCMSPGLIIPEDDHTLHVGDDTLTATVDLGPGRHDLCVQIGDGFHVAVAVQDEISVHVVDGSPRPASGPS